MGSRRLPGLVVAAAVGLAGVTGLVLAPAFAAVPTGHGYDVSWPQCGRALPSDGDFRIVGVNGGKPYTDNDCLAAQYQWARGAPAAAFYINTANPGTASSAVDWYGQRSPHTGCSPSNEAACAFNYGYHGARLAYDYAQGQTGGANRHSWWLDVETANSWSSNTDLNVASIVGAAQFFREHAVPVGVYSTDYQWRRITGGFRMPDVPNWVAGARTGAEAASWCAPGSSFTGGPVNLIQWVQGDLDHNFACAPLPQAAVLGTPPPADNPLGALLLELLRGLGLAK
ncbi:MAG: hypothetical protein ACRD2W_22135 [Acidimicrobiales bacterium]